VLDSIQDGISVLDQDLNIVGVNQTMKTWYAYRHPLEGKKCYDAYHGRSVPCEVCPSLRAMQTGKLEMEEVPRVGADGVAGALELFAFPMRDASGGRKAVVEYVRDVTERKRSEALLKEREQLYRALFEKNISVMLLIDPQTGAIVDANPSACAFYGHSKQALTSLKITDINILSGADVFEEMQRAQSEERHYFNFRHRLADGSIRDVEVFSGPITVGGRPLLCSIVHDISARKAAEMERERLIQKLQQALSEVKTLRGFLPICAACKKIRDDKGYWNQIESYLRDHSEANFSHGICPQCARRLYPDIAKRLYPDPDSDP
jgi:PAS domain S-box-containing protein